MPLTCHNHDFLTSQAATDYISTDFGVITLSHFLVRAQTELNALPTLAASYRHQHKCAFTVSFYHFAYNKSTESNSTSFLFIT